MVNESLMQQFGETLGRDLAEIIVASAQAALARSLTGVQAKSPANGKAKLNGARRGYKLDMTCRVAGCKNRSRGPRFLFVCQDHGKRLSKAEQRKALEAHKAKKAA